MKSLAWPISNIPRVTRETFAGQPLPFRCGRDFLFYALCFYDVNGANKHPSDYESLLFGSKVPKCIIWTMFHVKHLPQILNKSGLSLYLNSCNISSWRSLLLTLAFPRPVSYETLTIAVEKAIAENTVLGIDLAVTKFGLVDHVLFVYGYDAGNFYVLDTLKLPQLPYEKIHDELFLMKLPKIAVKERLGLFSRIWLVVPREKSGW